MKRFLLTMAFVLLAVARLPSLVAQEPSTNGTVVFEGTPRKKVEVAFLGAREEKLNSDQSFEFQVRILERNGKYYWATREMRELKRIEGPTYITYLELRGAGYIRTFQPFVYEMMKKLTPEQRKEEIGYVEHVVLQFSSITYFGDRK